MSTREPIVQSFLKSKELVFILFLTVGLAVLWVSLGVYGSVSKSTIEPNVKKQIAPLNPKLDKQTIDSLKTRKKMSQEDLQNFEISKQLLDENGQVIQTSPSPSPSTAQDASPSAEPSGEPSPEPTTPPETPAE